MNKYNFIRMITKVKFLRILAIKYYSFRSISNYIPFNESVFPELDVSKTIIDIKKYGYSLNIKLRDNLLTEILDFCNTNKVCVDRDVKNKIMISTNDHEIIKSKGTIFNYTHSFKKCSAIRKIAYDKNIYEIAKGYLGCEPKFLGTQVFWSYPKEDASGNPINTPLYGFHYDIDDLKFLKLFFYLNDVDENRGPHVIIENTHLNKNLFEIKNRRISENQAMSKYGSDRIKVITGKAGEGFFEDTFCYHKGTNPHKRRLMIQFQYAINDFNHQNDN